MSKPTTYMMIYDNFGIEQSKALAINFGMKDLSKFSSKNGMKKIPSLTFVFIETSAQVSM